MHPIQALRKHFRRGVLGHLYFIWGWGQEFGKNYHVIIELSHRVILFP